MAQVTAKGRLAYANDFITAGLFQTDTASRAAAIALIEAAAPAIFSGNPAIAAGALAALNTAISTLDLVVRSDPGIPKLVPGMTGIARADTDESNNLAHTTWASDLGPTQFWKDRARADLQAVPKWITASMLDPAVFGAASSGFTATISGTTPNRVLTTDSASGTHATITTTGDPSNPLVTSDGWVTFDTTTGRMARKADGTGEILPAVTGMVSVSAWADSGTAVYTEIGVDEAEAYVAVLANLLGMGTTPNTSYYNGGRGGQMVDEIGFRQGGVVWKSASSVTVPASGSVTIPLATPLPVFNVSNVFNHNVTFGGIAGTLSRTAGSSTFTFTRTTSGTSTAVAAGTQIISSVGLTRRLQLELFGGLMNDIIYDTTSTSAAIAARGVEAMRKMAAYVAAYSKRFLILGTWTQAGWESGSAQWNIVKTYHDALAAEFGDRFVNFRDMVIANAATIAATNGITLDATDLAKLAANTFPPSFMADSVHYKDFIHTYIAQVLYARCVQKGWV